MTKKKLGIAIVSVVLALAIIATAFHFLIGNEKTDIQLTVEEATKLVNEGFDKLADDGMSRVSVAEFVAENNHITVNGLRYGSNKDIILDCTIETLDIYQTLSPHYDSFLAIDPLDSNGAHKNTLKLQIELERTIMDVAETAPKKTVEAELVLYEVNSVINIHSSHEAVNAVFGGIVDVSNDISAKTSYMAADENGVETEFFIDEKNNNVQESVVAFLITRYETDAPNKTAFEKAVDKFKYDFYRNFIQFDRWTTILDGLWVTIQLTFFSLIIGVILGFLVAIVRCTHIKSKKKGVVLSIFNAICQVYLSVIRGTPVMVQIMIIHFVVMMPMGVSSFISAITCFGLNSGAYVAEIVRGGIMSVDSGQEEAGRSLGFNYAQTMWHIVLPQAFKAVLPSLANEFVVLLKETSIAFYIGLADLMYSVNAIRASTYTDFMPLIAAAIIYLIMVVILSRLVNVLERRLRNSER